MSALSDYASYTFYRTFGGGPEGGYIAGENSDGEEEVRAVKRTWGTQFKIAEVPAMKPETLRTETKTEDGLTFVRVVGEWQQVYDKPEAFSAYCPSAEEEDNEGEDEEEEEESNDHDNSEPPEPSFTAEELARK